MRRERFFLASAFILVPAALLLWSLHPAARPAAATQSATVDPRLLIQPRTVAQAAQVDGLRLTLTAGPLVPGSNHFILTLSEAARPIDAAEIQLIASMRGMAMRPLIFTARPMGHGHYEATGGLTMFGQWRLIAQIRLPRAKPLRQAFGLNLDLPPGILSAAVSTRAANR
jgi:hypothetical protein